MKQKTKIQCPNCSDRKLDKEPWGTDRQGNQEWSITCMKCGFSKVVPDVILEGIIKKYE